jgi:hypothetical protein
VYEMVASGRVSACVSYACVAEARTHAHIALSGMEMQSQTHVRAVCLLRLTRGAVSQRLKYLHRATVGHRHHADSACQFIWCGMYARSAGLCVCMDACGNQTDQGQATSAGAKKSLVRAHQLDVPCAGTVTTSEGCLYTVVSSTGGSPPTSTPSTPTTTVF